MDSIHTIAMFGSTFQNFGKLFLLKELTYVHCNIFISWFKTNAKTNYPEQQFSWCCMISQVNLFWYFTLSVVDILLYLIYLTCCLSLEVQKGDYTELKEVSIEKDRMPASPLKKDSLSALPLKKDPLGIVSYGTTLTKDPTYTAACSWATADPSLFLIRGESYLQNHQKV